MKNIIALISIICITLTVHSQEKIPLGKDRKSENFYNSPNIICDSNDNDSYFQSCAKADINYIDPWEQNYINKYDRGTSSRTLNLKEKPCTWHPTLRTDTTLYGLIGEQRCLLKKQ
jgi:hypothetical protein